MPRGHGRPRRPEHADRGHRARLPGPARRGGGRRDPRQLARSRPCCTTVTARTAARIRERASLLLRLASHRGRTTIELVSIGVVDGTGRELYAMSTEFDPGGRWPGCGATCWTGCRRRPTRPGAAAERIRDDLLAFLDQARARRSSCGPGWGVRPRRAGPVVGGDAGAAAGDARFTKDLRSSGRPRAAAAAGAPRPTTTRWWTPGTTGAMAGDGGRRRPLTPGRCRAVLATVPCLDTLLSSRLPGGEPMQRGSARAHGPHYGLGLVAGRSSLPLLGGYGDGERRAPPRRVSGLGGAAPRLCRPRRQPTPRRSRPAAGVAVPVRRPARPSLAGRSVADCAKTRGRLAPRTSCDFTRRAVDPRCTQGPHLAARRPTSQPRRATRP